MHLLLLQGCCKLWSWGFLKLWSHLLLGTRWCNRDGRNLPPVMGKQWKMGISPLVVSFHLRQCSTEPGLWGERDSPRNGLMFRCFVDRSSLKAATNNSTGPRKQPEQQHQYAVTVAPKTRTPIKPRKRIYLGIKKYPPGNVQLTYPTTKSEKPCENHHRLKSLLGKSGIT